VDSRLIKALERAKRLRAAIDGAGVGKLDEALQMERERGGKRGLEEGAYDNPRPKQGRGGKSQFWVRGVRDNRRGQRPDNVNATVNNRDREGAKARKKGYQAS
jgi:hypothetical protein